MLSRTEQQTVTQHKQYTTKCCINLNKYVQKANVMMLLKHFHSGMGICFVYFIENEYKYKSDKSIASYRI